MKPQFTQEEYEAAKSKDILFCECYSCQRIFGKNKGAIKRVYDELPGHTGKYCSKECFSKGVSRKQEVECAQCFKHIIRQPKEVKENNFCSHSCSAIFNNKNKITKPKKFCNICEKSLGRSKDNRTACMECEKEQKFKEWILGNINLSTKYGHSHLVREFLFQIHGEKCVGCNFSGKNPITNRSILHVDHINGDHANSTISNVRLLCPNCHAMTATYGALNKGKGRAWKKKYYLHNY